MPAGLLRDMGAQETAVEEVLAAAAAAAEVSNSLNQRLRVFRQSLAADASDNALLMEKLWPLIAQNEPSLIIQLLPKLADDDCLATVDLLQALLMEHLLRVREYFSIQSLLQLLIYLACHPSWEVRKAACNTMKKALSNCSGLAEDTLFLFTDWLSLVGDRMSILKQGYMDSSSDSQLPSMPSIEILVNCLLLIAPYAVVHSPRSYSQLLLGSHHPCLTSSASPARVYKRLQRRLKQQQILFVDLITPNISAICKELFSEYGLFSSNKQVQRAALCSLSTLVTFTPNDTFLEFEKHFIGLQERTLHDSFSENDIKIFYTPEGQLSTEQGVYVAEAVTSKNIKLAKDRFPAYDDQDVDTARSVVAAKAGKRESSGTGKRETGKSAKKTAPVNKAKTAKEEARELLLKDEASVRTKVGQVQKNLSLMLDALGELAIANPIFTHGQLSSLVNYVVPLLRSAIVSDAAFRTMLRLADCTAPPLCNWAPEIAAAICVISGDFEMVLEDSKKKISSGLFEQIVDGLTIACKAGPLPADSFTFIFPIMERILLLPEKTCLHDDVLHILSMHLDPTSPLPRPRMLSVLYHVLSTVPAYQPLVGPMLNELCLGLRNHELAQALVGVYAADKHVRLACLNAIKCVPVQSVQQDLQVAASLWIATHDRKKVVAALAEELWICFGFDVITDYSGIYDALFHENYYGPANLVAAVDKNPDKVQISRRAEWGLYDNLVFCKMCIEGNEMGRSLSEMCKEDEFIEKFFCKTRKVFTPCQFENKLIKFKRMYNEWNLLKIKKDGRQRNPEKKFEDFVKIHTIYTAVPQFVDLFLMKMIQTDEESCDAESIKDTEDVLEHIATVNTRSNSLDEISIINTLEDKIEALSDFRDLEHIPTISTDSNNLDKNNMSDTAEDRFEALKISFDKSLKEKEEVERCLKEEQDKRREVEKEVHHLKEMLAKCDAEKEEFHKEVQHLKEMLAKSDVERKKLHKQMMELKGNIRVFCRVRPGHGETVVEYPNSLEYVGRGIQLKKNGQDILYTFDKVFNDKASQEEIFKEISELVQSALDGYKVTIFSYGRTGSGKTHTMIGKVESNDEGIMPRALLKIFETTNKSQDLELDAKISIFQIYNETISDLLDEVDMKKCDILTDENGNVTIRGLTQKKVSNKEEATNAFNKALKHRFVRRTQMNEESSRSHLIFRMALSLKNKKSGQISEGLLHLIDLAGSETSSTTEKVSDATKTETLNINRSLLALTSVFEAIGNGSKFLGYRNSKLTLLLQNCFTGDSKVLMFVNVSPELSAVDATFYSLNFAEKVNKCKIKREDKRPLHKTKQGDDGLATNHKMPKSVLKLRTVDPKPRGVNFGVSIIEPMSRLRL